MRDHEGVTVDGAPVPKPAPFALKLRELNPLPVPAVIELPIEAFLAEGGWVNTIASELE